MENGNWCGVARPHPSHSRRILRFQIRKKRMSAFASCKGTLAVASEWVFRMVESHAKRILAKFCTIQFQLLSEKYQIALASFCSGH